MLRSRISRWGPVVSYRLSDLTNQAGVDVNATDHDGLTPLHIAASWNLYDVLKELACLVGRRLNWDSKTDAGHTALELALNGGSHAAVVNLLEKGAAGKFSSAIATDDFGYHLNSTLYVSL